MKPRLFLFFLVALAAGLAAGGVCVAGEGGLSSLAVTPIPIPLAGELNTPGAEVSGMAWWGDLLVILPQYPGRFGKPGQGQGRLFGLRESSIRESLVHDPPSPVEPFPISFDAQGVEASLPGFEGWEALGFSGDRAFLLAEARKKGRMRSWLVSGVMGKGVEPSLRLLPKTLARVPIQVQLKNISHEALVVRGSSILALFEANGANVNPRPLAAVFSWNPEGDAPARKEFAPFPLLEYRVTDATAPDEAGCFWVVNTLFPGDVEKLSPGPDPWPVPPEAAGTVARERLIPLCMENGRVRVGEGPVLWLAGANDRTPRNWEAVARLEGKGFLLITDKHPSTILALVPWP